MYRWFFVFDLPFPLLRAWCCRCSFSLCVRHLFLFLVFEQEAFVMQQIPHLHLDCFQIPPKADPLQRHQLDDASMGNEKGMW